MRSAMKLSCVLFCIVAITFAAGCRRQEAPLEVHVSQQKMKQPIGRHLNPLRKELGLRLIGDDWVLYRSDARQEDWKSNSSGAIAKTVLKDGSGNVVSEEDCYYSGTEFEGIEGHNWENVSVTYDYRTMEIAVGYAGTNKSTKAILSRFFMSANGGTTNVVGAMAEVNKVVAGWPRGSKWPAPPKPSGNP